MSYLSPEEKKILRDLELTLQEQEKLERRPVEKSEIELTFDKMTEAMKSDSFRLFIKQSAKLAADFYQALMAEGIPANHAAQMAAAYCQNLSSGG